MGRRGQGGVAIKTGKCKKRNFSLDLIIHSAEDEGHDKGINRLVSKSRLPKILSYTLQFETKLAAAL